MAYNDSGLITYDITGMDFTSAAAADLELVAPFDMVAESAAVVVTTGVTVAASSVTVGSTSASGAEYGTLPVPIAADGLTASAFVPVTSGGDHGNSKPIISKGSVVFINNSGGSTAGVGNATVVFRRVCEN